MRVDFYVTGESTRSARLRLACRLTEKAYLAGQQVLVWDTDAAELREFDALLWTFGDLSFVPHAILEEAAGDHAPVLLSCGITPSTAVDVLVNLAGEVPPCVSRAARVIEIIDGDASRRVAGRTRFKAYRDMGCQPATHEIAEPFG